MSKSSTESLDVDIEIELANFMEAIEDWQSMIPGTPTAEDIENLQKIYATSRQKIYTATKTAVVEEIESQIENLLIHSPQKSFVSMTEVRAILEAYKEKK